jgi:hypothetical protein
MNASTVNTRKNKKHMRTKNMYILTIFFLFFATGIFSQDKSYNLLKFGVKGFGGLTDETYLNTMSTDWFDMAVEVSGAELMNEPITLPINIEYGFQPFIIIHPIRQIQIGLKMDYASSSLTSQFQNPLLNSENYKLNIKTKSYIPGIFTYITLGKLELGGGIFQSFTYVNVNDDFFGYQDKWYGTNTGYELSLGFSTSLQRHFGYTMSIKYRDLIINNLKDNLNRDITYSDNNERISLNMSGLIVEMGIYFQFIKIKKQKDEN